MNGPLSEKVIYMAFAVSHLATSFSKKGGQFRHQDDWIISGTDIARRSAACPSAGHARCSTGNPKLWLLKGGA
ncbi:hypothetical protein [Erwinia sp. OPT-41]|uniref:Uncharacterized protein n=1 Tax=Erwinia plantamica TaxID=3237104 RepID=A0ABW7CM13_9GAMM